MSSINCKFCGKDITGSQISCWPYNGYMCYECKHTKYRELVKRDAENDSEILKQRESLKPRDTIAWFLEKELGFKAKFIADELYFVTVDSLGNELKYWFIKDDDEWFMMFKGEGIETKYDCKHLHTFHYDYEEKDNKVGFWYSLEELENFKKNKSDIYGPDLIVARGEDVHI